MVRTRFPHLSNGIIMTTEDNTRKPETERALDGSEEPSSVSEPDDEGKVHAMSDALPAIREPSSSTASVSDTHGGQRPNPAVVYLARLAPGSRRTMVQALNQIAAFISSGRHQAQDLPWEQLRYEHAQAIRAHLAGQYSPATANKHLAALRGVLKEAWRLGLMDSEDYHRAVDIERVRGERAPPGRALSPAEARALFEACAATPPPKGARDAACLAILYGGGLRRAEATALRFEDYDPETGALLVHGKGNKTRWVYLDDGAMGAIEAWLDLRGDEPGPLLLAVRRGGTILAGRAITEQAIQHILTTLQETARLSRFSAHDLRRTYGGDLLDAGVDLVTVQALLGHADISTTSSYDRRKEQAKRRASGQRYTPYLSS